MTGVLTQEKIQAILGVLLMHDVACDVEDVEAIFTYACRYVDIVNAKPETHDYYESLSK